jgi:hypothetical protein
MGTIKELSKHVIYLSFVGWQLEKYFVERKRRTTSTDIIN